MSKVPSTQERFFSVIFHVTPDCQGAEAAAITCADIHQAKLLEMLDDLEDLIDPLHKEHFSQLKQRYEG